MKANPKVRFVWIGDGILRDRLVADLDRLGIRHAFILTGLVPPERIPELLSAVDAVIHPSLREGLARVLPQALLAERPVISYDIDGAARWSCPRQACCSNREIWPALPPPRCNLPATRRPGPRWDGKADACSPTSSGTKR